MSKTCGKFTWGNLPFWSTTDNRKLYKIYSSGVDVRGRSQQSRRKELDCLRGKRIGDWEVCENSEVECMDSSKGTQFCYGHPRKRLPIL